MIVTKLLILSESAEGVALGYTDAIGNIDPACVVLPTRTGPDSDTDAMGCAVNIVRSFNSHDILVRSLTDTLKCLEQAILFCARDKRSTKYWEAAASEARVALARAKETPGIYAAE